MNIKLRFVNQSDDGNKSEVVIYQKNMISTMAALPVAWKVIRYCGRDCTHPFIYPTGYEVAVRDEYGNYSPCISVQNGQLLELTQMPNGRRRLLPAGKASASDEIDVLNSLEQGAMDVCIFKAGKLMGGKTCVIPGQKAVFQYKPVLWIGTASDITQGQAINSAVISSSFTELSLLGVLSADIVMTGGGPGKDSAAYEFSLENIVQA